jgi:undecaprenyl-diphosphatase
MVMALAGLAALSVDVPLSRVLYQSRGLQWLHGFLETIEPFGQPTAILMTAASIALCDPVRRAVMPRFLAAALGSGLAADVVKLLVIRVRPRAGDLTGSALDTFRGWWGGPGIGSDMQSCPSAHTATAVGFCLALSAVFPGGRWLFAGAAALVALQRIETGGHYLSDTCWGAAIGCAVSVAVFRADLAGRWFDRKEREWSGLRRSQ